MIDIELDGFFGQELLSQSTQMLRSRPIVVTPACNLTSMQNCLFGGAGDNRPCSQFRSSNRSPGGSRNSRRRFATDSRLASHCRGRFPIVARTTAEVTFAPQFPAHPEGEEPKIDFSQRLQG